MTRTVPRRSFESAVLRLTLGDNVDLEGVVAELAAIGYQRLPQTEEPGDFSVRGGIVDLFSPLYGRPLRLELEDDVLSSIRFFDPADQRSLGEVLEALVIPARFIPPAALRDKRLRDRVELRAAEIGLVRKEVAELTEALESGLLFPGVENLLPYMFDEPLATLFDFLPADAITWLVEPGRIIAQAQRFADRVADEAEQNQSRHTYFPPPETLFLDAADLQRRLEERVTVDVGSVVTLRTPQAGYAVPIEIKSQASLKLTADSKGERKVPSFEPLVAELNQIRRDRSRALFVVDGPSQANRLRRHLEAYGFDVNAKVEKFPAFLEANGGLPVIMEGEIAAGAVLENDGLYIYSEEDIFGEPRARRRRRPAAKGILVSLEELKAGDFVVHLDHGIGKYRGLKHLKVAETEGDFMNLEYLGDDTLYVPVERINLVQRYVGGDSVAPKLDKLGGGSWDKVKSRTREAVLAMASELLDIYAAREAQQGHAFPHPGTEYEEFADRFEFQETDDQLAAIDQVLLDMSSPRPMDRLICGDAGFGKTEVALRAAMVAVADGYQVAMLVPTTVLAEQHFDTFSNRFKDVAVRIEMVSRFQDAQGKPGGAATAARRQGGYRDRHPSAAPERRRLQAPGPADYRRGASLRGRGQGEDQEFPQAGRRADHDRHAHPAHPAHGDARASGTCRSSRLRRWIARRFTPTWPISTTGSSARSSCANSTAAGRCSSCTTGSRTSSTWRAICGRWCPKPRWQSRTARWTSASWKS